MSFDEQKYQREYHKRYREEKRDELNEYRRRRYASLPVDKKAELSQKKLEQYHKRKENGNAKN